MKKLITFGLIFTLLSCSNAVVDNKANEEKTSIAAGNILNKDSVIFKKFIDKKNGFSVDYPAGWDTTKKDDRLIFSAFETIKDTSDKFSEGLNISVMPNKGASLDEIADESTKAANKYYDNPKIERAKTTNDNGILFITLSTVLKSQGLKLVSFSTFFIKDGNLYTLTQTTQTKKMKTYGPIFTHIINSYNWTKN